jgi:SAM-dependent methyltransferase
LPVGDLARLRQEYARRDRQSALRDLYSPHNRAHRFIVQQRRRAVVQLLQTHGGPHLAHQAVLEVGCGRGGVLAELLALGASARQLHGADLLPDRACAAHGLIPGALIACADGQHLPYPTGAFDLVLQFMVLTSVLDDSVRANLAREMLRVLKPGGLILWYDFWLNPTNPQTRGIRPPEIRRLFPGCTFDFRRITLAPPIARVIVPISWTLAARLERLILFNSHYLVAIRKPECVA